MYFVSIFLIYIYLMVILWYLKNNFRRWFLCFYDVYCLLEAFVLYYTYAACKLR